MSEIVTKEEVAPDDLMDNFRGKRLPSIIIFTVVIHAIVLIGTSIPFLMKNVLGSDISSELTEDQRLENAVREANAKMREIAEKHGVKPQELSSQFEGAPSTVNNANPPEPATLPEPKPVVPDKPKSAIEKELEVKSAGPTLPTLDDDGEEDLFK